MPPPLVMCELGYEPPDLAAALRRQTTEHRFENVLAGVTQCADDRCVRELPGQRKALTAQDTDALVAQVLLDLPQQARLPRARVTGNDRQRRPPCAGRRHRCS